MSSRTRLQVLDELTKARSLVQNLEDELLSSSLVDDLPTASTSASSSKLPLALREYQRYGRQMVLTEIGLPGQLALKNASILVIGAGALGCPVLLYLAAAGIGKITIIDHDTVELSNLHRQVLHSEAKIGMKKAESARRGLLALNSDIEVLDLPVAFIPSLFSPSAFTPPSLLQPTFSLILDCTDNPSTRHLINAYASAYDIPLVSGGAVRSEGVVGVYNLPLPPSSPSSPRSPTSSSTSSSSPSRRSSLISPILRGPCYACVFPPLGKPDPPLSDEQIALQGTGACSDEGVLGILCGMVGLGMASETMRVLLGIAKPTLHMFSPLSPSPFRTIKLRLRQSTCPTCSTTLSTTPLSRWETLLKSGEWNGWEDPLCELVGVGERDLDGSERIRVREFEKRREGKLIDVRSKTEFGICSLPGSINIPFPLLLKTPSLALSLTNTTSANSNDPIIFVCKKGNDSFLAAKALRRYLSEKKSSTTESGTIIGTEGKQGKEVAVKDLVGGIQSWSRDIDTEFPIY